MRHALHLLIPFVALTAVGAVAAAQPVLKREPPLGQLREGETVLVDDGTCGPGKILQVVGGNHVKVGGTKQIVRSRQCIDRR